MNALVLHGANDLRYETRSQPECREHEVVIRVKACGICGSDLPRALEGKVHFFPIVLGHEFSGEVAAIGQNVSSVQVGDRVTGAPLLPCMHCDNCRSGRPALCNHYSFIGSRKNGAMAEYVAVPEQNVLKLPDEVDDLEGAMIEPLTVALHGIERVNIPAGSECMVFGAGTIGLLTLQCLKARGAAHVIMVDIVQSKLDLAKKLGADEIVNPLHTSLEEYFSHRDLPEVIIETAGTPATQKQSVEFARKQGKVVFVGTAKKDVVLPPATFEKILRGELEVTGSWMSYSTPFPGYEWKTAIQYVKQGRVQLKPLLAKTYRLQEGLTAFQEMVENQLAGSKYIFTI
ncbi:galactitol-1-phosphate 5-dehydrogenase [Paenactinomyces guangxiensis]|uniref:Galactitol-1-phosphate 5-dehydrogenase n=2 Tax=Paenactinomyces guangxiensis TaxID=1490290 RepID=A0A7W1WUM4_9BACL|nr:galactitol-1-phosphate 5-dehydrogenase [Paenactinomyces guangxiensis]